MGWQSGTPVERESSPGVYRSYCPDCHSPLTYRTEARPGELDITLASLDDPGVAAPHDHLYMADAVDWDRPADGRPCHAGGRRDP